MDVVSKATRSRMMSSIRGKNTLPELVVRELLHSAGFRYRLHRRDLPGAPDLILPKYRAAILVHGCFWHAHSHCSFYKLPKSNVEFWQKKLERNKQRDCDNISALRSLGWRVLIIWECATRKPAEREQLQRNITDWLLSNEAITEISSLPAS